MYALKELPEDFVVEELLGRKLKESGRFLIIKVVKRERNTEDVAQLLARALRLPRAAVGYAGTKDRHAVTTQYFSLKGLTREQFGAPDIRDVALTPVGFLDEPLGLGALEGNKFTITIRNLDGDESLVLPAAIPNYYDEQRFSVNNAAIGEALIRKRFLDAISLVKETDAPEAKLVETYLDEHPGDAAGALLRLPRQLLKMYLHAFQSLLWNKALAQYIRTTSNHARAVPYSQGEFIFSGRSETVRNVSLPIPGFSITDNALIEAILEQEHLSPRDFVIRQLPNLSLEGGERDALIIVTEFMVSPFADDELHPGKKKAMITFTLPKGSYATIVVKALFA